MMGAVEALVQYIGRNQNQLLQDEFNQYNSYQIPNPHIKSNPPHHP